MENGPAKSSQNWLRNAFVEQINAQESAGLLRTVNKQAWAGEGDAEDAPPRKGFHLLAFCFALLIIFFALRLIALIYFTRALMLNIICC